MDPSLPINYSGAESDEHLVNLWLSGRPESTQISYRHTALVFLATVEKPLPTLTVADVVAWVDGLVGAENYNIRRLICVKSLLSFARETGYSMFNVGAAIRLPKQKRRLQERLMDEDTVHSMIAVAPAGRDRSLLRLLYASGCRVSEAVGLSFVDLDLSRGVVTFFGKGRKTRTVPVLPEVIRELLAFRGPEDDKHAPVFRSLTGKRLIVRDAQRIVAKARTDRDDVTPHWFRHAHATHTLDNGAPLHKLQKQLGHADIATTGIYLHVRADQGSGSYIRM